MSKKANPAVLGFFILLGLALGIGGLILFSSGKLFSRTQKFILYFDASLKGLSPGAPVKFRGVTIGSVAQVLIRHNQARLDLAMPVIIEVDSKQAQAKSDQELRISEQGLRLAIREGLRGKLDTESLVTGVLYVELEVVPQAPPPVFHQLQPEYPEVPTVPTDIQRLRANLGKLDLQGIAEKLDRLMARVETSLSQLNVAEINAGLTNLLGAANRVVAAPDLTNSLASLRRTLDHAETLLSKVNGRVDPLAESAAQTLSAMQQTLTELRGGIHHLDTVLEPNAPLHSQLSQTLDQLNSAARAVTDLAEFLERHPNALLTGRKLREETP